MEERSSKIIAIVALCIGIVGISLGFAAFSARLTVESGATVTVNEDTQFKTVFGFKKDSQVDSATSTKTDGAGAISANYAKSWTGITYDFTTTGQTVTYKATIMNDSDLVAYIDEVSTPTVASCEAVADTDGNTISADKKTAACGQINVAVNAPASIPAKSSAEITVTITGPTTPVDGGLDVVFSDVTIDYTTANPNA